MKIHPHHEIITSYLEGKEVEIQTKEGEWESIPPFSELNALPAFWQNRVYRVKPIDYFYEEVLVLELVSGRSKLRLAEHWEHGNVKVTFKNGKLDKVEKV